MKPVLQGEPIASLILTCEMVHNIIFQMIHFGTLIKRDGKARGTDVLNFSDDELSLSNPAKKDHKHRGQLGGKFGMLCAEG